MSTYTYFVQECPTCGRRLHVRVVYLGKKVVCQHCSGKFTARDPAGSRPEYGESSDALLRRVDELLQDAPRDMVPSRLPHPR